MKVTQAAESGFDMRDLGEVIVHDAEIEIMKGPGTAPSIQ
jgi:hypothetical protein